MCRSSALRRSSIWAWDRLGVLDGGRSEEGRAVAGGSEVGLLEESSVPLGS